MLWKTLEFTHVSGSKVKILEIPVLEEDPLLQVLIREHLQSFIVNILQMQKPKRVYSFKEYLKKSLKWTTYERLMSQGPLPYHA
ncbi:DUF2535 family protein [Bacillus carboniphilus]|uniref:DUF2535 family protein n=1 Tax=Bacillus carboniphilus TaxID=86663 RepID=A0ABP3GKU6_9BACI